MNGVPMVTVAANTGGKLRLLVFSSFFSADDTIHLLSMGIDKS